MEHALKTKEGNRLFGSRRFYSEELAIALPIMLQGLIQSMVSLVDNFMVADLGDVAMSGVNITGQILFAFMVVFNSAALAGIPLVPVVFGHLSESAIDICRTMVMAISLLMPVWIIGQAQRAIARSGGDTAMGAWADIVATALISMPLLLLLAGCSSVGPVMICVAVKGVDIIKLVFFHFWLKKEKWLKNLTEVSA